MARESPPPPPFLHRFAFFAYSHDYHARATLHTQGFKFMSDQRTIGDCLGRNLFGLPAHMMSHMDSITDSSLLFLCNKDAKEIYGIFRPVGRPAHNIEPTAYAPLSFPAQIRIMRTSLDTRVQQSMLSWTLRFGPLSEAQVEELQLVMRQSPNQLHAKSPTAGNGRALPAHIGGGGDPKPAANVTPPPPPARGGGAAAAAAPAAQVAAQVPALSAASVAMEILLQRLQLEQASLRARPAAAGIEAARARALELEDEQALAAASRDFVRAAAVRQELLDVKAMAEALDRAAQVNVAKSVF